MQRTIQIEFTELIDKLIEAGELPNFRSLRGRSEVVVRDAFNDGPPIDRRW